jgi:hypothetical protein
VSISPASSFIFERDPADLFMDSLTAAKEDGVAIEIDGKTVALGIPGKAPTTTGPKAYSLIPLARPGTADEAAAAMLLCVRFTLTG